MIANKVKSALNSTQVDNVAVHDAGAGATAALNTGNPWVVGGSAAIWSGIRVYDMIF